MRNKILITLQLLASILTAFAIKDSPHVTYIIILLMLIVAVKYNLEVYLEKVIKNTLKLGRHSYNMFFNNKK